MSLEVEVETDAAGIDRSTFPTSAIPGVSDQDRGKWLTERRFGVTATEVRDLYLGKISARALAEEKLGRRAGKFTPNAYTEWGVLREPVIAEIARRRYGLEPESRVWHSANNLRHLASPDGVGAGFDGLVIGEYKTGTPGSGSVALDTKGYLPQTAWQIYVMGAAEGIYLYEDRIGFPGSFQAGDIFERIITRREVEDLIAELKKTADAFLAEFDAIAQEEWSAEPDPDVERIAAQYLEAASEEKRWAEAKKAAHEEMLRHLDPGRDFTQSTHVAKVTYSAPRTKHNNTTKTVTKPVLRITAGKEEES